MSVRFCERKFLVFGCSLIVALVLANLMALLFKYRLQHDSVFGFVPLFEMNTELNVPTYVSSIGLLFCGLAALYVWGRLEQGVRLRMHWLVLALAFFAMSLDEFAMLHERLDQPVKALLEGTSGVFYYAWIIPVGTFALVFALAYLPFVWRLPPRPRVLIILAGASYVAGAIGLEMLGGAYHDSHGGRDFAYGLITTAEETLEMLGILLAATGLLSYIASEIGELNIALHHARPDGLIVRRGRLRRVVSRARGATAQAMAVRGRRASSA